MSHIFKLTGIATLLVGIYFGLSYLYKNFQEVLFPFFAVFGIICFVGLIAYLFIRSIYGKNWKVIFGTRLLLGEDLMTSSKKLVREAEQGKVARETMTEFGVHIFWRLTDVFLKKSQ